MLAEANVAAIASSRDGTQAKSNVSSLLCNFTNPQIYFSPHRTFSHQSNADSSDITGVSLSASRAQERFTQHFLQGCNQTQWCFELKMLMSACLHDHIENANMLMFIVFTILF